MPFSILASSNPKKDLLGKVDPGFFVPDLSASGKVGKYVPKADFIFPAVPIIKASSSVV